MGRLDQLGDQVRQVIRAYHGSPYDFDRFDASKIGTGEGAQSFGHGLYFAGEENVAKQYRNMLGGRRDVLIGGKSAIDLNQSLREGPAFGTPSSPQGEAVRALMAGAYGIDTVDELLRGARRYASDNPPSKAEAVHAALDALASEGLQLGPQPGHMYEVGIGHPEDRLIDYDRGLEYQAPHVRERLARLGYVHPSLMRMALDEGSGGAVVRAFRDAYGAAGGAKILFDSGIPGVRYLDQGSRAAGEGTHNYVIFPGAEDQIRILRKFAVPGVVGAGAAAMSGEE